MGETETDGQKSMKSHGNVMSGNDILCESISIAAKYIYQIIARIIY